MLKIEELCEKIRYKAVTSLLYEVSATPKPGLVDRLNQGSHRDMDFFSFIASAAALSPYFYQCAKIGAEFPNTKSNKPDMLIKNLRPTGLCAEQAMYRATGGVNTHKGLIFSLGLICAATALCFRNNAEKVTSEEICNTVSLMTKGICERELRQMDKKKNPSNGEMIYLKYGVMGIRKEVECGFPTVREHALPVFISLTEDPCCSLNNILVQTLLHIMAVNDDTNVLTRGNRETLEYVKNYSKMALDAGGILTPTGTKIINQMDKDFIERNISPGGSADLLAVTIMLA